MVELIDQIGAHVDADLDDGRSARLRDPISPATPRRPAPVGKSFDLASRGEDSLASRKVSFQPLLSRIRELVTETTDRIIKADWSMKKEIVSALIVLGVNAFITQTLPAAQVLAVSSNGKWDMEYDGYGNVNALAAKALAACKAKGGTDPKIVWAIASSVVTRADYSRCYSYFGQRQRDDCWLEL